MALEHFMLQDILRLKESPGLPNNRVLCLGYPDLLCEPDEWTGIDRSKEAAQIKRWHSWPGDVLDTEDFFKALGLEALFVDRAEIRGREVVADLNTATLPRGCGLIIDPGTSEHVFNVGHLFSEIVQSLEVGGIVMHTNPLNMPNHGFWSVNPTAFADFYAANGCGVSNYRELTGSLRDRVIKVVPLTTRFDAARNSAGYLVAIKEKNVPVMFPVQTKYRQNPTLQGAA